MSHYTHKISTGSMAAGISTVVSIAASIVTVPLFIKAVGTDLYGIFIVISSVVGFISIGDFGMIGTVANKISYLFAEENHEEISNLFNGTLLLIGMVVGGFWLILLILFLLPGFSVDGFLGIDSGFAIVGRNLFFLFLFFGSINIFFGGLFSALFRGFNEIARYNVIQTAYTVTYSIAFILFLLTKPGLVEIAVFQGVSVTLRVLFLLFVTLRKFSWLRLRIRLTLIQTLRPLWKFSAMFFMLSFFSSLISRTDLLVLSHVLGAQLAPTFAIGDRLLKLPSSVVKVADSAEPSIAQMHALKDEHGLSVLYAQVVRMNMIFKMTPLLFILVYSREIITLWVGASFFHGYAFMAALFVSYMVYAWVGSHIAFINAMFKHKTEIIPFVLNVIINLVASVLLARSIGLIGIVAGTILGNILTSAIYFPYFLQKQIPIRPFRTFSSIMIQFFIPAAALFILHKAFGAYTGAPVFFFVSIMIVCAVYGILVYVLVLNGGERSFMAAKIKSLSQRFFPRTA